MPGAGRRPALVLTRSAAIPVLSRLVVAPATRTVRRIPTEVALDRGDGMPDACGEPDRMRAVCAALAVAIDC